MLLHYTIQLTYSTFIKTFLSSKTDTQKNLDIHKVLDVLLDNLNITEPCTLKGVASLNV